MRTTSLMVLVVCASLTALPSLASSAATNSLAGLTRFAGTVERVDGNEFLIRGEGDTTASYALARSTRITTVRSGTLADLAAGQFVGCTAVAQHGGALRATECHIFPQSMRGAGEGHNPMGSPNTTMTNGNIATMTNGNVASAAGSGGEVVLTVTYQGGSQRIEVSPSTRITVIRAASRSLLKPGAKVMGASRTARDGTDVVQMLNIAP
ncbi:MAG TPA: hypothetical protein VMU67_10395 [Steroidobacteraceae bacterium]|nr:hypothetical protein [Steroidobacteraceae bacterium]